MSFEFKYSDVFLIANDKEVFEIVDSGVDRFNGKKVVMKQTRFGMVMKNEGTYHTDDADDIVVPVGAVTGAKFRRVENYKKITLDQVAVELAKDNVVFVGKSKSFMGRFSDFDEYSIFDFDDLLNTDFYIKK